MAWDRVLGETYVSGERPSQPASQPRRSKALEEPSGERVAEENKDGAGHAVPLGCL